MAVQQEGGCAAGTTVWMQYIVADSLLGSLAHRQTARQALHALPAPPHVPRTPDADATLRVTQARQQHQVASSPELACFHASRLVWKSVAVRNLPVCTATAEKVSPLTMAWRRMMLGLPSNSKAMSGKEGSGTPAGCGEGAKNKTKGGGQWQPVGMSRAHQQQQVGLCMTAVV